MRRLTIQTSMALVIQTAIFLAAVRSPDQWIWQSTIFTVTVLLVLSVSVSCLTSEGPSRAHAAGFALFAWAYLLFGYEEVQDPWNRQLLTGHVIRVLSGVALDALGPPTRVETLHQIGHSLCCVLFGYSGAAVAGRLVGPKRGRANSVAQGRGKGPSLEGKTGHLWEVKRGHL